MKKSISLLMVILIAVLFFGCAEKPAMTTENTKSEVEIARQEVISKFKNDAGVLGTSKYIEDRYKLFPDDETIANIYYYCIAKEQYDNYKKRPKSEYYDDAKEYALKIDPEYKGEFADEMHAFVNELVPSEELEEGHDNAAAKEDRYNSLTNSEKKAICNYIQSRYDYYDRKNGGYSGDKYSDTIMREAAQKYGLTESQIDIIWANQYSY